MMRCFFRGHGVGWVQLSVLNCPYCRKPLQEDDASCPSCRLSLAAASKLLGPVPLLQAGISDTVSLLNKREFSVLNRAIARFEKELPQCRLHLVIRSFDPEYPLATHLFWLFNKAGLSSHTRKGGENRDVLIGLDPKAGQIGFLPGYGLEPFLSAAAIDQILERARPAFEEGYVVPALEGIIGELQRYLRVVAEELKQTFGLEGPQVLLEEGEY